MRARGQLSVAVLAVVLAVGGSSCASVRKQEAIDRIARATRFDDARTGTIVISTRSLTGPPISASALGITAAPSSPPSLRVLIDASNRRAVLLAPPRAAARIGATRAGGFPALVLFTESRVYVRSADADLVGARPWLAADVKRLGAIAKATSEVLASPRTSGDLVVLSPIDVLDLARGFLTGSVTTDAGPLVTYRGRTSLDKDFRERRRDPSDADAIRDLLRSFSAKDDVNPITVQIDASGALRRVAVSFVGRPEYGIRFATTLDLELENAKEPIDTSVFATPRAADVVLVESLGDLRAAVDQWTAPGGGA